MTEWVSGCCGADYITPQYAANGSDVINRCRNCGRICGVKEQPSVEVKEWDEYEVKGNPPHFSGNRFVSNIRSDSPADMEHLSALKSNWANIAISKRHVRQEITEWEDITKEELEK